MSPEVMEFLKVSGLIAVLLVVAVSLDIRKGG